MNKIGAKLAALKDKGVKWVKVYYTREVNGKRVPNYKRILLTTAVVAAAAGGAYYLYKRHKKHGHVIVPAK